MFWKYAVASSFIKITLRHGCSAVNLLHIFTTVFLRTPLAGCFRRFFIMVSAWKFLLEEMFFSFLSNIMINLTNLPKQLFIIRAWSFTRNRTCHSLKLKSSSLRDSIAEFSTAIYGKGLSFTKVKLNQNLELKIDFITDSFTAVYSKDMKLY